MKIYIVTMMLAASSLECMSRLNHVLSGAVGSMITCAILYPKMNSRLEDLETANGSLEHQVEVARDRVDRIEKGVTEILKTEIAKEDDSGRSKIYKALLNDIERSRYRKLIELDGGCEWAATLKHMSGKK